MRRDLTAALVVFLGLSWALAVTPRSQAQVPRPVTDTAPVRADLNGDDVADVVTVSDSWVRVDLSGHARVSLGGQRDLTGFGVADIDHDGDRDLVGLSRRGYLLVWRNDGAGHFSSEAFRAFRPARSNYREVRPTSDVYQSDDAGREFSTEASSGFAPAVFVRLLELTAPNGAGPGPPALVNPYGDPSARPGRPRSPPARFFA